MFHSYREVRPVGAGRTLSATVAQLLAAVLLFAATAGPVKAHPLPDSVLELRLAGDAVKARLRMPLLELQRAVKQSWDENDESEIRDYLSSHLQVESPSGAPWTIVMQALRFDLVKLAHPGDYQQLAVEMIWTPPKDAAVDQLCVHYEAVIHQVITHELKVAQQRSSDSAWRSLGRIKRNVVNGLIQPLSVNLSGDKGTRLQAPQARCQTRGT